MMKTNPVVHFEIPAVDYERAKKFYVNLFGWKIDEWPGAVKYGMATTGETDEKGMLKQPGEINGAIMQKTDDVQSTIVTLEVDSIDDYLAKIVKMGGRVQMEKVKVGDMGYNARFFDSEGNIVGLWENV
jgi:predicted enzyme related to lactoylglutathione lyase